VKYEGSVRLVEDHTVLVTNGHDEIRAEYSTVQCSTVQCSAVQYSTGGKKGTQYVQ
jgi:hypothetical protein